MLLLLLAGCLNVDKDTAQPDDSGGYVFHDTAPVVDTGDSAVDTGDTGPVDTADTAPVETGDTGPVDTAAPTLLALDAYPPRMVVNPGATWATRVLATDLDGVRGDATGAAFAVDDPTIATVDADGVVTALAEGATTLRVALGGLEATTAIEVRAAGTMSVSVVDASTGLPLQGIRVSLQGVGGGSTDAAGTIALSPPDGGPVTVTAWVEDDTYDAVSVVGLVGREIVLPIWPKDVDPDDAHVVGTVDFSGVDDAGWTEVVVGFAAAAVQGELGALVLDRLFSDDRAITVYGVDANAPANLFVEGVAEDYDARAQAGPVAVWGLAGPLPISEVSSGLNGSGDALRLLVGYLDRMSWGMADGATAALDAQTTLHLAPGTRFDDTLPLTLPALSAGFNGTEDLFVLVTEERAAEGFVGTGLGLGNGTVDVARVADGSVTGSLGTVVLAYGQVGGLGSGGATASSVGRELADGTIAFADLLDVPTVDAWDPATRALAVTVDGDAHFVRVRLEDSRHRKHDVFVAGSWTGEIPRADADFGIARATVEVQALRATDGVFEQWMAEGILAPDALPSEAATRTVQ